MNFNTRQINPSQFLVISHKKNTFAKNRLILMQLQKILNQLLVVSILVGGCQTVDLSPSIVEDPSTNQTVYRTEQRVGECEEFFTMNWGWFGDGDDGSYYIDSSTWKTEDDELPLKNGRKIVYGFTH